MSNKTITRIATKLQDYPKPSKTSVGPTIRTSGSNSVVNRQHVQLIDKNGDITYVTGTYQTGGGSGYKLLIYTVFECITDEITDDLVVIFEYPQNHTQTNAFKQAEKKLKKMTKSCKNIRVMNWEQYQTWAAKWQKKNPVGSVPRKRASVNEGSVVTTKRRKKA